MTPASKTIKGQTTMDDRKFDEALVALTHRVSELNQVLELLLLARNGSGEYLTVAEAAREANLTHAEVESLARHHVVRAIRLPPATWLVHRSALAYLKQLHPHCANLKRVAGHPANEGGES
jgi:hypothetical protein